MTASPPQFEIRFVCRDSRTVITVEGELDLATRAQLRTRLQWVIDDAAGDVHLDLAAVTYIESCGVCEILTASATLLDQGRRLRVTKASRQVARLFEMCGITDLLADCEPLEPATPDADESPQRRSPRRCSSPPRRSGGAGC